MYRLSRLKYVFPVGLFVCLFLDGAISHVWAPLFFHYPYSMASELVLLWLTLAYFFENGIEIPLIRLPWPPEWWPTYTISAF